MFVVCLPKNQFSFFISNSDCTFYPQQNSRLKAGWMRNYDNGFIIIIGKKVEGMEWNLKVWRKWEGLM